MNLGKDLHAIVLSGGGADGAYQIGFAKALFNGKSRSTYGEPLEPEVFTGTSIGSFNAAFLVSQWQEFGAASVANLEKVWVDRIAWRRGQNGGFHVRFNPFELLDPRAYLDEPLRFRPLTQLAADLGVLSAETFNRTYHLFSGDDPVLQRLMEFFNLSSFVSAEPWDRTIREEIDFKKIRESPKQLRIAATDWAFGEIREFRNRDMTEKLGPAAIRASSAIPGFYPPAQVGAQTYVDGAVLLNTPLKPAIGALIKKLVSLEKHAGAGWEEPELVLHVVYMNTEVERMPIEALASTLQTFYRTQVISWAAAVNRDIERAYQLNKGLEVLRGPEKEPALTAGEVQVLLESAEKIRRELERGRRFKLLTIHRYFPPDGLDGAIGFLDVRRRRIERLIDEGFYNTVNHDCVANGCILAGRHRALAER